MARKKFTVIPIPPKPPDEAFETLDRLAQRLILEMRKSKPARDEVMVGGQQSEAILDRSFRDQRIV